MFVCVCVCVQVSGAVLYGGIYRLLLLFQLSCSDIIVEFADWRGCCCCCCCLFTCTGIDYSRSHLNLWAGSLLLLLMLFTGDQLKSQNVEPKSTFTALHHQSGQSEQIVCNWTPAVARRFFSAHHCKKLTTVQFLFQKKRQMLMTSTPAAAGALAAESTVAAASAAN